MNFAMKQKGLNILVGKVLPIQSHSFDLQTCIVLVKQVSQTKQLSGYRISMELPSLS